MGKNVLYNNYNFSLYVYVNKLECLSFEILHGGKSFYEMTSVSSLHVYVNKLKCLSFRILQVEAKQFNAITIISSLYVYVNKLECFMR